jgi:hypothetical protein
MNKYQLQEWTTQLQYALVANQFCHFLSSKLKQYQKSNASVALDIINVFLLMIVTTVFFTVINYGVYKTSAQSFKLDVQPSFFIFFYYSISHLFCQSIDEVVPITNISRLILILEMLFSFSLIAILISLFFSIKYKRNSQEIDEAIRRIRESGVEMDGFIKDNYKLSVRDAIQELARLKVAFINIIFYLSTNIEADERND